MMRLVLDASVLGACVALVASVAVLMFSKLGAGMWFSWHPVLMTLAFPCLMTMGRWSYTADDAWGLGDTTTRRKFHGGIMAFASVAALVGYLAIFMAHLPKGTFFGYDFKAHEWNPDTKRVFHSIFGYIVLIPMISQAIIGVMKYAKLSTGVKSFRFHGILGKIVMVGGAIEIVVAILFWGWSLGIKVLLITAVVLTLLYATAMPRPEESSAEEQAPINGKDSPNAEA